MADVNESELPSGKLVIRIPRTLHKRLSDGAKSEGVSLNILIVCMLTAEFVLGKRVTQGDRA